MLLLCNKFHQCCVGNHAQAVWPVLHLYKLDNQGFLTPVQVHHSVLELAAWSCVLQL